MTVRARSMFRSTQDSIHQRKKGLVEHDKSYKLGFVVSALEFVYEVQYNSNVQEEIGVHMTATNSISLQHGYPYHV